LKISQQENESTILWPIWSPPPRIRQDHAASTIVWTGKVDKNITEAMGVMSDAAGDPTDKKSIRGSESARKIRRRQTRFSLESKKKTTTI
jgi:hypothetical protein